MIRKLFPSLAKSIDKIRQNPQLWYTLFVAVMIMAAFIFVANRFVTIAQDAQDRLVNVRVGAMQSSFVQFVPDYIESETDLAELQSNVQKISVDNATIREFKVVKFEGDKNTIIASLSKNEIGKNDNQNEFLYGISKVDPNSAHTMEQITEDGERIFTTVRVIKDNYGNFIGAVLTEQSLSQADVAISNSIQNSVLVFIIIVVLIMYLFFRHSRIIDYSTLYRRIKEVDRLKDDFISMASHELRTPLTVIRGYAENLLEGGKNLTEDQKKSVERIDISARQLDNLVNDMLDVSRIEQGRIKIETEPINPNTAIADVVSGFVKVAEDKGLKLNFKHLVQENVQLNLDPDKFRQAMNNLIGNAIKYTPEGEVKVTTALEDNRVVIKVIDSGVGMSSEEQKRLFEKFYRVKNEKTKDVRGTGLGLWITKQIVELMNGKISVESIKGVGTHFIVSFPISNIK